VLSCIGDSAAGVIEVYDLRKVWEVYALMTKTAAATARATLDRVASQVHPMMRRDKWHVKVLSEFW
jgi:DNA-dependent metalloprotease WSS1